MTPSLQERLRLMLVTDPGSSRLPLEEAVPKAIRGGVTAVQVRGPGMAARDQLALTRAVLGPARAAGALVVVNDRVDVALAAGADGAHLKRVSLPVDEARRILGPDRLLGVSTHTPEEVERAFAEGADYVVFGPVFRTPSKEGILEPRGPSLFAGVASVSPGPVIALGGVDRESVNLLPGASVAVVRAILGSEDPEEAARELLRRLES